MKFYSKAFFYLVILLFSNSFFWHAKAQSKKDIKLQCYKVENGWGYDILINEKVYIHQPNIPAIQGNLGFKTKKQAKRVGDLMISKWKKNIIPPFVSIKELDSLKIVR